MHLHGSLILQQLLHYNKPIKLVRSCLQLPAAQLAQLLADPRGCHVTDSFMSRSGRVKSAKLYNHGEGHY